MATRQSGISGVVEFEATPAAVRALSPIEESEIATVQVVLSDGRQVSLPDELMQLLSAAVRGAADGHDVAIVLRDQEVTPAKAGDLLGLSRQYVDRLISEGVLPARRLPRSTHRRLRLSDVLNFAAERNRRRKIIVDMVDELVDGGAEY